MSVLAFFEYIVVMLCISRGCACQYLQLSTVVVAIMESDGEYTSGVPKKDFWLWRCKQIPAYKDSPWDYYERFVELGPNDSLVLCNDTPLYFATMGQRSEL